MKPIVTALRGSNSALLHNILKIHLPNGGTVADVTYGNGHFWTDIPADEYNLLPTDLKTGTDLKRLPYLPGTIDALVLDPPYRARRGGRSNWANRDMTARYNLDSIETADDVYNLYINGAREARRVLRHHGRLIVKCMDEICGGQQRWWHITLMRDIENVGYRCEDLFILLRQGGVVVKKPQRHGAKNHSYFLVFYKIKRRK
ncbi:MAG: hypothetical protein KAV87_19525 [Desulfobacteraceae bacterium]|nr:hypothetical protein [Desulfobacteraceae bacterium]